MTKPNLPHRIDELLLRHASGALDAGLSLLVETYLDISAAARRLHAQFEAIGGLLLDDIEPADVDSVGAEHAPCARSTRRGAPVRRASTRAETSENARGIRATGAALRETEIRPWRWIAPGVRSARIALAATAPCRAPFCSRSRRA